MYTVYANGWRRKRPLIEHLVKAENIDVLAIWETHLRPRDQLALPGFHCFRFRTAREVFEEQPWPWQQPNTHLANLRTYSSFISIQALSYFLEYISTLPRAIVMGDFKARHTAFGDTVSNRRGTDLADCLLRLNLFRIPNRNPTFMSHLGSSIIDIFLFQITSHLYFQMTPL